MASGIAEPHRKLTDGLYEQAFENTSTSVAASQMRNALNNLADGVKDPKDKQVRGAKQEQMGLAH